MAIAPLFVLNLANKIGGAVHRWSERDLRQVAGYSGGVQSLQHRCHAGWQVRHRIEHRSGKNNSDAEVVIEATGPHPHVVDTYDHRASDPRGSRSRPDGKWAAAPLLPRVPPRSRVTGSGPLLGRTSIPMSIGPDAKLAVTGSGEAGGRAGGSGVQSAQRLPLRLQTMSIKTLQVFQCQWRPAQVQSWRDHRCCRDSQPRCRRAGTLKSGRQIFRDSVVKPPPSSNCALALEPLFFCAR